MRLAPLAAAFVLLLAGCSPTTTPPGGCATTEGAQVLRARCLTCHSVNVTGGARGGATIGVDFDTEADVRRWMSRIRVRVFDDGTMPPGGLPDCEKTLFDAYLTQVSTSTCTPSCAGRACGDDGCGGTCGTCAGTENCTAAGACVPGGTCSPDCTGKQCGSDGCAGSCGTCGAGTSCNATGQCACVPQCTGRTCGPDGCGGTCGACAMGPLCNGLGPCTCGPGRSGQGGGV